MIWKLIVTLSLLLSAASAAFAAEVYRTVDADGNIVYSDRPADSSSIAVTIRTGAAPSRPTVAALRQPNSESNASRESAGNSATEEPDEEVIAAAEAAQAREDRQRNCTLARQRNESYSTAHRLYKEGDDGEREYLDAAAIDSARAQALASIAEWCN